MLCRALLHSTHAFASGRQALMQFTTQVHAAKGQFIQRRVTAKSRAPTTQASREQQRARHWLAFPLSKSLKGIFVFKRPGQFIWAITQPYAQTLQADDQDPTSAQYAVAL